MFANPAGSELGLVSHVRMRKALREGKNENFLDLSVNTNLDRQKSAFTLKRYNACTSMVKSFVHIPLNSG